MKTIFREYDIRGIYPHELYDKRVQAIGFLLGEHIVNYFKKPDLKVAIGYDARVHSKQLFEWLAQGFAKAGVEVLNLGLVATPVAYFTLFEGGKQIAASVMITGSHNPKEYNGFKITLDKKPFFGDEIYALGEEVEKILQAKISTIAMTHITEVNYLECYIQYLTQAFKHLQGLQIPLTLDCGNGVAGVGIAPILNRLNIAYDGLYMNPDGEFPNHHPDPTEEKNLIEIKQKVTQKGGVGFAFDGDGDRIAVITPKRVLKGDELAIIFAKHIPNPVVVGEVKCSMNMYNEINRIGRAYMYKTGHSNIKTKIKELNASLGAEVSGHLFFNDRYFGYDDAIYAALRVLELMQKGVDLDREIESLPVLYSTDELKIQTTEESKFSIIATFRERLHHPPSYFPPFEDVINVDGVRINFEEGWALIRASNTTPMLVTRFESYKQENLKIYEKAMHRLLQEINNSSQYS
ncbi:phospho-sugar mutase [Helicobacter monodelphidis]|uniref:phosphomannomutase/phosphoglucomutase n=1 Tax=Helicobacter sp. 15-1451 TaxID=2004995 RepID=UPI000DCF3495|nr:phosphomannomutase/phosphoglucomutase [Helicobacter sp. 15-1451]RAX58654.1 phospho-sugar mutase [Helicobacter sp. 15-1451]